MNTMPTTTIPYRRRVLLFGLFLLALCSTHSAVAQDQPLIYSIQLLSAATIYESIPQGDRLVGPRIRFSISLSRPLTAGQELRVVPVISNFSSGQNELLRLVSGDGVTISTSDGDVAPVVTFSGANAQTAILEWGLYDNSFFDLGGDNDVQITLGASFRSTNIPGTIQPSATNGSITVTVLDDEYLLCFSQRSYSVREGNNSNLPIIELLRGINRDTTIGLNRNTTVTLIYTDDTAVKNVDYDPISPVVIEAGENSFTLENLIVRDNRIEGEEQFFIVIRQDNLPSNLTDTQMMDSQICRQTTVTIADLPAIYIRSKVFLEGPLQ